MSFKQSNQEKYDFAFSVLTNAYMNNTLAVHNPCGCVCGNLIAHSLNIPVVKNPILPNVVFWEGRDPQWYRLFCTVPYFFSTTHDVYRVIRAEGRQAQVEYISNDRKQESLDEVYSTPFSRGQLQEMEWLFEKHAKGKTYDDEMYNGLTAVLNYLGEELKVQGRDLSNVFKISSDGNLQKSESCERKVECA